MVGVSESDSSESEIMMEHKNLSLAHTLQSISDNRENQCNRLESCEYVACSDFNKSHQPAEVEGSRTIQREKLDKSYSRLSGTRNIHG